MVKIPELKPHDFFIWKHAPHHPFPGGSDTVKNPPAMQDTWAQSLGQEDPLEKGMATHSSIPAWRIPRTEEPGGLQSMGSHRVGHDWATKHSNSNNCYRQGSRIDANSRLRKYDEKQHIYMISKYHPTGCWLITKGKIATLQWISWQTLS